MSSADVDDDLLAQVTSAFSRHDLEAIASLFAEDGEFVNARGASPLATAIAAAAKSGTTSPGCSHTAPISPIGHSSRIGSVATRPSCSGTARQQREAVRYKTGLAVTC
jgi:hypothetical protein